MTRDDGHLLSAVELTHHFPVRREKTAGRSRGVLQALRGVDLGLVQGETLALVGESGSGKTTLARCLLRLVEPTSGRVHFRGENVLTMDRDRLLAFRKKVQIVFQDPFGSLNPRLRAGPMLEEVLKVHGGGEEPSIRGGKVRELLHLVGLHQDHASRYPHEFSGGQRQRLGIARALAVGPEILILDEPVSALDLSIQAQILNLLRDLQERLSLTLLLVAHDLSVVRHLAGRVAVMHLGRIVEIGPTEDLFSDPLHPYTRSLLAAADPGAGSGGEGMGWMPLPGEPPSPVSPPSGCAFHPRCPHPGKDQECVVRPPELDGPTTVRRIACWKGRGRSDRP